MNSVLPAVLPPVEDEKAWRDLLNRLYLAEEDELFVQLKALRAELRRQREREGAA